MGSHETLKKDLELEIVYSSTQALKTHYKCSFRVEKPKTDPPDALLKASVEHVPQWAEVVTDWERGELAKEYCSFRKGFQTGTQSGSTGPESSRNQTLCDRLCIAITKKLKNKNYANLDGKGVLIIRSYDPFTTDQSYSQIATVIQGYPNLKQNLGAFASIWIQYDPSFSNFSDPRTILLIEASC